MSAAVVLIVFITIALLDSIHFRPRLAAAPGAASDAQAAYGTRTLSLLDVLLRHAVDAREKTYSVPLAYWSFQRETAVIDGRRCVSMPRLALGGAHLKDPAREWKPDLCRRVRLRGLGGGLGSRRAADAVRLPRCAAVRGSAGVPRWRRCCAAKPKFPWRAILATALLIAMFIGWLAAIWPVYHPFGTDRTGNDVLYQALKSIRTAVVIGSLSTIATLPLAIALGVLAGYFKGWVDDVIQYFYTVLSAIPPILLVAAFVLLINVYIDQQRRELRHRRGARRVSPLPAVRDPRHHRLGDVVPAAARRDAEDLRAGVRAGGARLRRQPLGASCGATSCRT